jgi:flagellar biosynthesis/type III secretory pathway protein FliH
VAETQSIPTACTSWAPPEVLRDLHESQSGDGRHKCAACAYQRGYEQGQSDMRAKFDALAARIAALEMSIAELETGLA